MLWFHKRLFMLAYPLDKFSVYAFASYTINQAIRLNKSTIKMLSLFQSLFKLFNFLCTVGAGVEWSGVGALAPPMCTHHGVGVGALAPPMCTHHGVGAGTLASPF